MKILQFNPSQRETGWV